MDTLMGQISARVLAGSLMEISGPLGGGKTEVTLQLLSSLLAREPAVRVAWIERCFTVYPCALIHRGVPLDRVLFVNAASAPGEARTKRPLRRTCKSRGSDESGNALWAARQVLRSQVFSVVVLGDEVGSAVELRRLQLAAEKSQAAVILLPSFPRTYTAWPIAIQLRVERDPRTGQHVVQTLKFRSRTLNPAHETPTETLESWKTAKQQSV